MGFARLLFFFATINWGFEPERPQRTWQDLFYGSGEMRFIVSVAFVRNARSKAATPVE